jgi:prepilin-type N-terminal cleavage/methylation domain-containing protein
MTNRPAHSDGFTLIELLVSLTIGVVVLLGAFALLESSQRASARVSDRVDAVQRGRTAMEQIVQELRSQVCPGTTPQGTPITTATGDTVIFSTDLGGATSSVVRRKLQYSSTSGSIVETTYPSTGSPPTRTFQSTPSRVRTLVTNVVPAPDGSGGTLPVFRYYGYTSGSPATPDALLSPATDPTALGHVVRVAISYRVLPTSVTGDPAAGSTFLDSIFVRAADPAKGSATELCS